MALLKKLEVASDAEKITDMNINHFRNLEKLKDK